MGVVVRKLVAVAPRPARVMWLQDDEEDEAACGVDQPKDEATPEAATTAGVVEAALDPQFEDLLDAGDSSGCHG